MFHLSDILRTSAVHQKDQNYSKERKFVNLRNLARFWDEYPQKSCNECKKKIVHS